jgi:hypothetical protein
VHAAGDLVAITKPDERRPVGAIQVLHEHSATDVAGQEVRRGTGAVLREQAGIRRGRAGPGRYARR